MRKIICLLAAVFALSLTSAQAQSESKTQKAKETIAQKAKKVWKCPSIPKTSMKAATCIS